MPKVRLGLALFLFVSLATPSGSYSYSPEPVPPGDAQASQTSEVATLLDRSYDLAMSESVGQLDRIRLLNNLVTFAPDIAPAKVVKWANTLLALANDKNFVNNEDLLPAWDRMAFKKNAVVAISKVSPDLGMEEFAKLGPQPTNKAGQKPEDVRAFGSRVVFLYYYRLHGHDGLAKIQEESAKLVGDGAYPFHAVSLLFSELAAKGETASQDINTIFDTALHYYDDRCPPNVENQDLDFYTFIHNAKPVVNPERLKRAVNALADHLTIRSDCGETKAPKNDVYSAVIETNKGTIRVSDKRMALLIQSLSLINEGDSDRGMRLKSRYAELAKADATINQVYSTFYPKSAPDAQKAEQDGLEQALKNGIQKIRDSNPAAALEMTKSLNDPETKTAQIASVLPTLAQRDLQRMKQLYAQTLNDLGSLKNSDTLTEATMWMTEAAYHADDPGNFQYFATKTFSDSLRAFQASYSTPNDQRPVYARPGYRQLTEFVKFSAAHGIRWPLDEVEQLSNDGLKANLLIYAALGMSHR